MNNYETLESLFKKDIQEDLNKEEFIRYKINQLEEEISKINRNMGYLPTSKEIQALPDLKFLAEITQCFREPQNLFDFNFQNLPERKEEITRALFGQVTAAVLKTKIYNDKTIVQTADQLFQNLIIWCTRSIAQENPSQLRLLSTIIDINVDYYKSNGREDKHLFPFGFGILDQYTESHKQWVDNLKPGDKVDSLKQHLSVKFWSPAVIQCNDWSLTKLKFEQEDADSYVYKKYLEIQPYQSKKSEYEWRVNLKVGDKVDYYSYRTNWILCNVIKVENISDDDNEFKKTKITLEPVQNNDELQTDDLFYTLIFSGNIAPAHKYSNRQDDSFDADDELYLKQQTKKRYAIMRQTNSPASSIYFVKYINLFGEMKGFDFVIDVFSKKIQVQEFTLQCLMGIVRSSIENFVRPFIKEHGQILLQNLQQFLKDNSRENLRKIDKNNLKTVLDTINALVNRVYGEEEAQKICQQNEIDLSLICLKSEYLEKQLFGSKLLNNLERRVRNQDTQLNEKQLAEILKKENVFQIIIKGHPSLVQKGDCVIKTLFSMNEVTEDQLQDLWSQILKTDIESRNALLNLLKQSLNYFTLEQLLFFLDKMIESAQNINNQELFDLLFQLKKTGWNRFNNFEIVEKVNEVQWEIIQSKQDMKKEYLKDVTSSFVDFIKEHQNFIYIDKIIDNICRNENKIRNIKLLKKLFQNQNIQKAIIEKSKKKHLIKNMINSVEEIIISKKRNQDDLITQNSFNDQQKLLIKKQLSFIEKIFKQSSQTIRFVEIEKIWKLFKENNLEYNYIYQFLLSFFIREPEEGFTQKYQQFYDQNIEYLCYPGKNNLVSFFWIIMIKMNIDLQNLVNYKVDIDSLTNNNSQKRTKNYIVLNKEISQFVGLDKLWEIYNFTDDQQLELKLCEHFTKIYSFPIPEIPCNKELYQKEKQNLIEQCKQNLTEQCQQNIQDQDQKKIRKASKLLKYLILNEEIYGFGDLKSWNYFLEDSKIGISFERENTYYYREKKTILIKKNKTLAQLKKKIAIEASLNFRSVQLEQKEYSLSKYSHLQNSLCLYQVINPEKRHFILKEIPLPEKEMAAILTPDKQGFTEKALQVFTEIFQEFSTDGKMSKQQLAQFTMKATDGTYCSEEDDRVRYTFKKYSDQNSDCIQFEGFLQFFLDSAQHSEEKLNTVRYNIQSLGYDKTLTLKKVQNSKNFQKHLKQTIRYSLAQNDQLFKSLLNKLDDTENSAIKDLLQFLTPNINFVKSLIENPITKLKEDMNNEQWNYCCVVLYQLMFKQHRINKLLQNYDLSFNLSERKNFYSKLYNQKFLELMLRKLQSLNQKDKSFLRLIYFPLRCLEGLFQIGIDFFRNDYIEDTINFIAYSMKLKKNKMKKKNKEKQNKESQTETKSLQDYGPKEKEEKEKVSENKEVIQLKKIKDMLESQEQNINEFMQKISFIKLNSFLIQVLQSVQEEMNQIKFGNKKSLTKALIILLLSSLTLEPENLKNLLNKDKGELKELLFKGLTSSKPIMRLFFKNFYVYLTSNLKDFELKRSFLRVIMTGIKETQQNDEMHVLIELASNILNEISEMKQQKQQTNLHEEFNFSKIFIEFSEKLYNYNSKENEFDNNEDNTLIAIITFMEKIILADDLVLKEMPEQQQKKLIMYLFKNCLFNIQNESINFEVIKCKSNKSRQKAHELMTLMAQSNVKLTMFLLIYGFQPLSKLLPAINSSKQSNSQSSRKKQYGYTGLRNPGCICYMNAMLQQFYCIPTFRYGILMADDYKEKEPYQTQNMLEIDDNVFHQLQKMFAYLDYSQRQDFFPNEFCLSYKDSSKQRVNVLVQQDAYEFLNMIFDKMETALKPTPFKGIIDSVFMGKNCQIFTCQGCQFKRQRYEISYNLSLEVKNIDNLQESFEKFIQKEVISDFMCDSCKQKKDVVKQTYLKDLPNVLVIHLQKIIFDLESLTNIKISSRYEFPQNLNLQKFVYKEEKREQENEDGDEVQEDKPDDPEDYEYKLVGVVIHRGNAHFGHYISLINTNRKDPNRPNNTTDEWLEFDDSKISPFKMENFEDECFGTKIESEYHQGVYNIEGSVSQSAYILVYDKVKKSKVKFTFKDENKNEVDKIKNSLVNKDNFVFEDNHLETDFYNLGIYLPQKYKQEIEQDNIYQLLENQLFSSNFTNTFASMLYDNQLPIISLDMDVPDNITDQQKALAKLIIKIVPEYFTKVYCIAYQNYKIKKIVYVLESALMIRPDCILEFCQDFFFTNWSFLTYQLIQSMDSGIQYGISEIFTFSITILMRQYDIKMDGQFYDDPKTDKEKVANIFVHIFEKFFANNIRDFEQQKISRKTQYYFQSFKNICILNSNIVDYLLQKNFLNFIIELYYKQDPSNCRNAEHALTHILHIIYLILQNIQDKMNNPQCQNYEQLYNYFNYFARPQLLFKIMKEDYRFNKFAILNLLTELICQNNFNNSFVVIKKCLKCLNMASDLESIPYLEALTTLMNIQDQFQDLRIKAILGVPNLNEQQTKINNQKMYIYGLSKESSLKRNVYKYQSLFGNEQGLIQEIFSHKDSNEVICLLYIHYIFIAGIQNQKVLNYLIDLPPQNYVSTNLFDWVKNYTDYNLKNFQKSYNAPKPELMYNYFQNLHQIIIDFEQRLRFTLESRFDFSQQQIDDFKYFVNEEQSELNSVNQNYLIGKTIAANLVQKKVLQTSSDGQFSISVYLIKVSLMKNKTNGIENLDIPKEALSYESYIQKNLLEGTFKKLIGSQNQQFYNFDEEDESKEDLRPLGEDSDDDNKDQEKEESENQQENNSQDSIKEELTEEDSEIINKRYILRISYTNHCQENYSLQLKIDKDFENDSFENNDWIILAKSGKKDYPIINQTLKNCSGNFKGLKISARYLENPERNLQNCQELNQLDFEEIYKLETKEQQ